MSNSVHPNSVNIWQRYEYVHRTNFVIRSGFAYSGCYGKSFHPSQLSGLDYSKPESVTEHASGCVEILHCLKIFYPNLLSADAYNRAAFLLKDHDNGEIIISDQVDNGTQSADKIAREYQAFEESVRYFPASVAFELSRDFLAFQRPFMPFPGELNQLAQLARVIDKNEVLLSGLFYEAYGTPGDLCHHKSIEQLSESDQDFIRQTGSTKLVDVFTAHVLRDYHQYYGFPYVFDIIRAGVMAVRGEWFGWFVDFCRRHQIPPEHVVHPLLKPSDES